MNLVLEPVTKTLKAKAKFITVCQSYTQLFSCDENFIQDLNL